MKTAKRERNVGTGYEEKVSYVGGLYIMIVVINVDGRCHNAVLIILQS